MEFSPSNTTKTFSMSTILLTGAAGFIGTETARLLTAQGHTVVGLDNFNDYYAPELKRYRATSLKSISNFQLIEGDIRDGKLLEALFQQYNFDAVINLAAMAGVRYSIEQPLLYTDVNATGFLQLLEAMRKHGVTQIVQASTSSLYAGLPMPFKEELDVRTTHIPIRSFQARSRSHGIYLLETSWIQCDRAALFHGVWPRRQARHGTLSVHGMVPSQYTHPTVR